MIEPNFKSAPPVKWLAQLTLLLAASALSTGCSMLPFGGHGRSSAKMASAMRPKVHEVSPNAQNECLAEDSTDTIPATPTDAHVCATCACSATASAAKKQASPAAAVAALPSAAAPSSVVSDARADRALQRLMDGNKRFVEGDAENDVWARALRGDLPSAEVAKVAPTAIVLACGDAPLPPELAFDARPGELLVLRSAGGSIDDSVIATARDAIQQYEIPLILVLGCGGSREDVDAAAPDVRQAAATIRPAAAADDDAAQDAASSADRLAYSDAALGARVVAGRLQIVAASCDGRNGQVMLEPAQAPERLAELSRR
jgi:carbonic anhydrase